MDKVQKLSSNESALCPCLSATYVPFKLIFCVVYSNGCGILLYIYLSLEVGTLFFCAGMCVTARLIDFRIYIV
jgi:hypothetical protein